MAREGEKSVAMTAPHQMRGVVIISLPRSDCDDFGKTMCAAMWQQGQEQQIQEQVQEQQTLQPPAAGAGTPTELPLPHPHHHRRRAKGKRIRRSVMFLLFSMCALYLAYKLPTLYYSEMELEEENEEKNVHVYTLHPKYTSVPIKMSQVRRNLLERDLKRLGKVAAAENVVNNNHTVLYPVRGNIYPDGYVLKTKPFQDFFCMWSLMFHHYTSVL